MMNDWGDKTFSRATIQEVFYKNSYSEIFWKTHMKASVTESFRVHLEVFLPVILLKKYYATVFPENFPKNSQDRYSTEHLQTAVSDFQFIEVLQNRLCILITT